MTVDPNTPMISVVVTVYNLEDCVPACLDSLIAQDDADFEIIVVDDESTDSSFERCRGYENNPRVRVFTKDHEGLSAARNFGLEKAQGQYVVFVDGDDVVDPRFLSTLLRAARDSNAEMSVVGFEQCPDQEAYARTDRRIGDVRVYEAKGAVVELLLSRAMTVSACGKLAPRRFWQRHPFPLGAVYEDLATTVKVVIECSKVAVVDASLYGQVNRRGSMTRRGTCTPKQLSDYFDAVKSCSDAVRNRYGASLDDEVRTRTLIEYARIDRLVRDEGSLLDVDTAKVVRNRVRSYLWKSLRTALASSRVPSSVKVLTLLDLCAPQVYSRLFWMRQQLRMRRL